MHKARILGWVVVVLLALSAVSACADLVGLDEFDFDWDAGDGGDSDSK